MSPLRSFAHTTYSALSSFFVHGTSILCCPPHTRPSILLDKPFCKQIRFTSSQLTASPPNKALIWNKESLFRSERAAFATQLSPLFPAAFASFSRKRESERAKSAFYCLTNRQTLLLGVRIILFPPKRRREGSPHAAQQQNARDAIHGLELEIAREFRSLSLCLHHGPTFFPSLIRPFARKRQRGRRRGIYLLFAQFARCSFRTFRCAGRTLT